MIKEVIKENDVVLDDVSHYEFDFIDNSYIVPAPVTNLKDWFTHAHSVDEINAKLRVNLSDRYNDESDNYHIEDTENADFDKGMIEVVTPYEKDKLNTLKSLNENE